MGYGTIIAFAGGALAAGVAQVVSKQPAVRQALVNAVACGMQLKAETDEALQSIKDDAEDVYADARRQAKVDAAIAARRAEIEERVRAQVEAEMGDEAEWAEKAVAAAQEKKDGKDAKEAALIREDAAPVASTRKKERTKGK